MVTGNVSFLDFGEKYYNIKNILMVTGKTSKHYIYNLDIYIYINIYVVHSDKTYKYVLVDNPMNGD